MKTTNLKSVRQMWEGKSLYWINNYATIIRYVSKDYEYIFDPIIKGTKTGKRYFVKEENIKKFVKMFENSELV